MTKLFILGITGYVGGDTLYAFTQAHPGYEITALVRTPEKGAIVAATYPDINLVYGDLDSTALLTSESAKADIVLQLASSDHISSVHAILAGLARTHTRTSPGYLIHMSGTASLFPESLLNSFLNPPDASHPSPFGSLPPDTHIYDDMGGRADLYTRTPANALHKPVDLAVTHAGQPAHNGGLADIDVDGSRGAVRTAIVSPPGIYGAGRGPMGGHSKIGPGLVRIVLGEGHGVLLGEGTNVWNVVHVADVVALLGLLVEEAVVELAGGGSSGGKADWGHDAYYLCEAGEMTQREFAGSVAREAGRVGLIKGAAEEELKPITRERADQILPGMGALLLGSTSRGRAIRARERLGWAPVGKSWDEELPGLVQAVATEIGMWKE